MWGVNIFRCFIKSVNFETDNKSPGINGLTEEFYKDFLNELAPCKTIDPFQLRI